MMPINSTYAATFGLKNTTVRNPVMTVTAQFVVRSMRAWQCDAWDVSSR